MARKDTFNNIRPRSKFNKSFYNIKEIKDAIIHIVGVTETLPGDVFYGKIQGMIRFNPMVTVPMTQYKLELMTFYVPTRLLWDDFPDFITRGDDGKAAPEMPYVPDNQKLYTVWDEAKQDYKKTSDGTFWSDVIFSELYNITVANDFDTVTGQLKPGKTINQNKKINALPSRAYNLIFNEYFRDQQLQTKAPVSKLSGLDSITNQFLLKSNWTKDRYNTARPNPQLGDAVVVPVTGSGNLTGVTVVTDGKSIKFNHPTSQPDQAYMSATSTGGVVINDGPWNNTPLHYANEGLKIQQASPINIEGMQFNIDTFLKAEHLQKLLRLKNSFGNGYYETLQYMGILVNDMEIQRPVLVNMTTKTVQFSEILQTAFTPDNQNGVGSIYGHGIGGVQTESFVFATPEYGYLITLAVLRPVPLYMQQLPEYMKVRKVDEIYDPLFEFEGDDPISNYEVYNTSTVLDVDPETGQPLADGGTFGWEPKYNRYKTTPNLITGRMGYAPTLTKWHGGRDFSERPRLNSSFIQCNPTNRFYSNKNDTGKQGYFFNNLKILRQVKKNSGTGIY